MFFFYKQKTAYEIKECDWSSDVCSSDLSMELADALCSAVEDRQLLKNRGVKSANFHVLRGTRMPAVLVEVGFLSNSGEESRLANKNYRYRIAETLASGVIKYKKLYDKSNGFTSR